MKQRTLQLVVLVMSVIALAGFAQNAIAKTAALPACVVSAPGPSLISACGCAITKSGSYRVSADLTGVAAQDCIDISASKVNLRTDGHAITGIAGSLVGINILKSGSKA